LTQFNANLVCDF